MRIGLFSILIAFAVKGAPCFGSDFLTDLLLQNEIISSTAFSKKRSIDSPLVIFSIRNETEGRVIDRAFLMKIALQSLRARGLNAKPYPGDFELELIKGKLPLEVVLTAKMVIEIDIQKDDRPRTYRISSRLCYLVYENSKNGVFLGKRLWTRRQDIKGISEGESEDWIAQYLQKELKELPVIPHDHYTGTAASSSKENTHGNYSLSWHDLDGRRNHFTLGVTAGTPALANLYIGFWGSKIFPIVIGVSGMYYGDAQRGAQFDLGWAFDNEGEYRQVLGLGLALLNETTSNSTDQKNDLGDVISTTTTYTYALRPFLGPTYTAQWQNFRGQLGVTYRLDANAQSSFRILFQIGYSLPIF